jgi:uncharacterized SAM-binding protein YcdF (DUF218 family)
MFFFLSKTLDLALDPLWWTVVLVVAGVVVLARGKRRGLGVGLALAGVVVLLLASLPAVSNRLLSSLEAAAPNTAKPEVTYDAIVLLGGMVTPLGSLPREPTWNESIERLMVTRDLLAAGRAKAVIVSGGELGVAGLETEAEYLARQLVAWGVSPEQIIIEGKSLNTRENATFSKALVAERGFTSLLVVTSAFHMSRAAGCFRAVGLEADFLPVDYRVREPSQDLRTAPRSYFLRQTADVIRERFGALVYRVMGYAQ